jgi:hypothetical protein
MDLPLRSILIEPFSGDNFFVHFYQKPYGDHGAGPAVKKTTHVSFTLTPDWSLARSQTIELVNSLGACDMLMRKLDLIQHAAAATHQSTNSTTMPTKMPRKSSADDRNNSNASISSLKKPKLAQACSLDSVVQRTALSVSRTTSRLSASNLHEQETLSFKAKKSATSRDIFRKQSSNDSTRMTIYEHSSVEETIYYETDANMSGNGNNESSLMLHGSDETYFTAFSSTARHCRLMQTAQDGGAHMNSTLISTAGSVDTTPVNLLTKQVDREEENSN